MNLTDLFLAVPLAWALYKGFRKGLILELATLIGWVVGLYAGLHFSHLALQWLKEQFHADAPWLPVLAFALVFLVVFLGVWLLGKLIDKTAGALMLGFFNKIGGAFFALMKMALILSFLILLLNRIFPENHPSRKKHQEKSLLYKPLSSIAVQIMKAVEK
ncbi:MAG TPA: CvpA family protein [Bacteroidales bacterium]|nr:CvpA family protein [Bacteroidales bacterium]HSA43680.1 CvpA family protein [Bacteroidales bacterium]